MAMMMMMKVMMKEMNSSVAWTARQFFQQMTMNRSCSEMQLPFLIVLDYPMDSPSQSIIELRKSFHSMGVQLQRIPEATVSLMRSQFFKPLPLDYLKRGRPCGV